MRWTFWWTTAAALCCCAAGVLKIEARGYNGTAERPAGMDESVADLERKVKRLVNTGVKFVLPYILSVVTEMKMSGACTRGFFKLMTGVMDISDWAVKMMDAVGKPSAGILEGTPALLGDYDECLNIAVPKSSRQPDKGIAFHGQFCMVQIHIPESLRQAAVDYQMGNRSNSSLANSKTFLRNVIKIGPLADLAALRMGVCIPSTCTTNDLQEIVNQVTKQVILKATVMRCEKRGSEGYRIEHIIILTLMGMLALCVGFGTLTELLLRFTSVNPLDKESIQNKSLVIRFILSFSVGLNISKLTSFEAKEDSVGSIRGMKFIFVCFSIITTTFTHPHNIDFFKYRSVFKFYNFIEQWWFVIVANASTGVDTLFFIAGFEITHRIWKKRKVVSKIHINIPKFIVKWYFRITFAQVAAIALFLCLPLIGGGPFWEDFITPKINNCRERWWLNVLSISNFWAFDHTCLSHTWLFCCLMQLFLMAPVLLWILSKWTAIGIFVNVIIILGSCVAIAMVTMMNEMPPVPALYFISVLREKYIWDKLFIQAYDHVAPFCIGMLSGYFIAYYPKVELRKVTVVIGWCLAMMCYVTIFCGLYGYRHGEPMEITLSALYASFHRIGWAIGTAWIIFACAHGYGGFVNCILSWKVFIPLDRLSGLIYLFHPLVIFLHGGTLRERIALTYMEQTIYIVAYIVITCILAGAFYVCCCVPFMFVEKTVWGYGKQNDVCKLKNVSSMIDVCLEKGKTGPFRDKYSRDSKLVKESAKS